MAVLTGVVYVLWAANVATTYLMVRPADLQPRARVLGAALVTLVCLAVAAPVSVAARYAMVQADLVDTVFEDNETATVPQDVTEDDPWGGRLRVNLLLHPGGATRETWGGSYAARRGQLLAGTADAFIRVMPDLVPFGEQADSNQCCWRSKEEGPPDGWPLQRLWRCAQLCASLYAVITAAGIRPAALTCIPWSRAHARTTSAWPGGAALNPPVWRDAADLLDGARFIADLDAAAFVTTAFFTAARFTGAFFAAAFFAGAFFVGALSVAPFLAAVFFVGAFRAVARARRDAASSTAAAETPESAGA